MSSVSPQRMGESRDDLCRTQTQRAEVDGASLLSAQEHHLCRPPLLSSAGGIQVLLFLCLFSSVLLLFHLSSSFLSLIPWSCFLFNCKGFFVSCSLYKTLMS